MVARWLAADVPVAQAWELVEAPTAGRTHAAWEDLPAPGLVVVEGDFGTGKSLASERHRQADIAAALSAITALSPDGQQPSLRPSPPRSSNDRTPRRERHGAC